MEQPTCCSPRLAVDSYAVELQALEDYRNFSATTIQRCYRGWICRAKAERQVRHVRSAQLHGLRNFMVSVLHGRTCKCCDVLLAAESSLFIVVNWHSSTASACVSDVHHIQPHAFLQAAVLLLLFHYSSSCQRNAQWQQQQAEAAEQRAAARLNRAARTIQDAWQRFSSRRIFRYYRDLIRFREAGEGPVRLQ
jgi:hypothetical protein